MRFTIFAGLVAATFAVSTSAISAVVGKEPVVAAPNGKPVVAPPEVKIPSVVIKGTVKAMRGHSFGYRPPKEGQEFELNLQPLGKVQPSFVIKGGHIPFPDSPPIVDVDWSTSDGKPYWLSLRIVYKEKDGHKVTLDVVRHPGFGDPHYVKVWALIEYRNRTFGVAELHGLIVPPQK